MLRPKCLQLDTTLRDCALNVTERDADNLCFCLTVAQQAFDAFDDGDDRAYWYSRFQFEDYLRYLGAEE